jgi:hypothetical protein
MTDIHDQIDYGRCDRCRYFSALGRADSFENYAVGICQLKWRDCSPYDAAPLVPADSHCPGFEQRTERTKESGNQAKGDHARAANLSPERRSEIARKATNARWGSSGPNEDRRAT